MSRLIVFILISFIIVLQGCNTNNYFIFSYSDFENYKGKIYYKDRYLILPDSLIVSDSLIAFSYNSIKAGSNRELAKKLSEFSNKQTMSYLLSYALYKYSNHDYNIALNYLNKISNNTYIISLLIIDCEYELYKFKMNKEQYYLDKLQSLINSDSSGNIYLNYMVKQREKNIKYGT